ncbi:hypothetical protein ACOMHN_051339 [Nucella lapillus]
MSGHYSLVTQGLGGRSGGPEVPAVPTDAYRSPFSPGGHASFVWSERAMPLTHILKDNSLPLVVKISEEANVRTGGENMMDFRQPLLLYRQHQVSRLYARNVTSSGTSKKEVGPFVVIPQNYQGLFRPTGQPPKPITLVSTIARLMPPSVLSRSPCEGYVCTSATDSDVIYQKTSLEPGLYVIKDLLEDDITVRNNGQKNKKSKLVRCLRCVSEANRTVLFPLKASGQFFLAGLDSGHSGRHSAVVDDASRVFRWTELMTQLSPGAQGSDNNNCDITADLVHGKPPPQECSFTGTLAFKHVTTDHTVIGCTTAEDTPRLFELSPTNTGPSFDFALNQDCFDRDNYPLAQSLKFSKEEFDRYVSEMKVRRDYEVESAELRESST